MMLALHYYNEILPKSRTVDAVNMKELIDYARHNKLPIVQIESFHYPARKQRVLKRQSAKYFRNVPGVLSLSPGVKVMITHNINPSVGLFNGAICTFVGVVYLATNFTMTVTDNPLPDVPVSGSFTEESFQIKNESLGKQVYIPAGTFYFDDIEVKSNVHIVINKNATIKSTTNSGFIFKFGLNRKATFMSYNQDDLYAYDKDIMEEDEEEDPEPTEAD